MVLFSYSKTADSSCDRHLEDFNALKDDTRSVCSLQVLQSFDHQPISETEVLPLLHSDI